MRIVFAGTPEFAATTLRALLSSRHRVVAVYTQPDRPAGRGRRLRESPVKRLADESSLPVHQPAHLRDADAAQRIRDTGADVMVVAAYGLILPPAILAAPRLGCINVHASLLPRWRGAAPIQRAIIAGDGETGVSIMQMDAGLDTGPVYATAACHIGPRDTAGSLDQRLARLGAESLLAVLDRVAAGEAVAVAQEEAAATLAPRIAKSEAHVDWARPAVEIERLVRAFDPWPVAYTLLPGADPGHERLRIWSARPEPGAGAGAPGTVLAVGPAGIVVATGAGCLVLEEVQPAGARRMSARDYANARAPAPGTVLA